MKRMPHNEFRRAVARVMQTLPVEFQPYLHNVVVDVADTDIEGEEL